ncbi:MAG: hypothetical protein A2Y07_02015 [Planctomycetes bacterium GWF2_50_10]|nr:MAG: hypothetical protein A2Y07_02015 [Planctomycetes bacterium GWF2_50_10]
MRKSFILQNIALVLLFSSSAWSVGEGLGPMAPAMNMPGQPGYSEPSRSNNQLDYRQRDGQDPKVQAAVEDIKAKLTSVIKLINEANAPSSSEMGDIEKTIKSNLGYANRMAPTEKAYFQTLAAWYNYFNGQPKKARQSAMAAFQADKAEINAKITLIAMALANDDTRSLKSATTMTKPKNADSGTFNDPTQVQMPTSQLGITLDFNADSLIPSMLGQKMPVSSAKCINGTTLTPAGKTLYAIIWNLASIGEAQAADQGGAMMPGMGMPGMGYGGSGQQLTPMQAFAGAFQKHFSSQSVAFLGINIDSAEQAPAIMGALAKNAWPWAQAMANDSENSALAVLAKTKISSPMLVVTSADGTIIYAGSPTGVLPRILAQKVATGAASNLESAVKEYAKNKPEAPASEVNTAETQPTPAVAPVNEPAAQVEASPATEEPQVKAHKSEEETFNPQASKLYEQARGQMKTAKVLGYRAPIDMCRTVIRDYPETPEAEKCRQLLREVPAAKRQQFGVTNEEMGQ